MTFNLPETHNVKVVKRQKVLKLTGTDGNAYALMGRATRFNKDNKIYNDQDLRKIMDECRSKDYNHLLVTLMYFFNVK